MKHHTRLALVAAIIVITVVACKKKEEEAKAAPSSFTVANLQDQVVKNNDSMVWDLPVDWRSGDQEKVTISIDSLPAGVTATPSIITGRPSFHPQFKIKSKRAEPGIYPIYVSALSASQGVKSYDMQLTVEPSGDCLPIFTGSYYDCSSSQNGVVSYHHSANIYTLGKGRQVQIRCYCKANYLVTADIDCDQLTIKVPSQLYDSDKYISGSGSIVSDDKIVLRLSVETISTGATVTYIDTLR